MRISQGANAVKSGQKLELYVENVLNHLNLDFSSQDKFRDCYGNKNAKMDFYVDSLDLAIECKRQQGAGTADQKLPFVVENLRKHRASNGLIVLDGEHYKRREGIHEYLTSQISDTFDWVFIEDFEEWLIEQTSKRQETK